MRWRQELFCSLTREDERRLLLEGERALAPPHHIPLVGTRRAEYVGVVVDGLERRVGDGETALCSRRRKQRGRNALEARTPPGLAIARSIAVLSKAVPSSVGHNTAAVRKEARQLGRTVACQHTIALAHQLARLAAQQLHCGVKLAATVDRLVQGELAAP